MKIATLQTLRLIPILLFFSCATPAETNALTALANGGLAYAGGNVTGAVIDAVSAAAYGLQALEGTSAAANPTTVWNTATAYGLSSDDATAVKTSVSNLVSAGKSASSAVEAVAEQMYSVASTAAAAKGPKGKSGNIFKVKHRRRWETDGWVNF